MTEKTENIYTLYTIGLEFCGFPEQKHVLRFCGEFIAPYHSLDKALAGRALHQSKLNNAFQEIDEPLVIESYRDFVLLLKMKEKSYRVVYGAQVSDFNDLGYAFENYSECKLHAQKAKL